MRASAAVVVVVVAVFGGAVLPAAATVGALGVVGDAGSGPSVGVLGGGSADDPADVDTAVERPRTADQADVSANGSVSPGERLAGVVGMQGAELGAEVSERRLANALNASASDRGKATVVAAEVSDLRERLERLRTQRERLRTAVQNGSISPGEYRAKMAVLATNISATQRLLNASAAAAADLPTDVLNETGVNVTAIQRLREEASELGGPEVAEIARSIGGPESGRPVGPPGDRGPPEGVPGNASESGPPGDRGQNQSQGQGTDAAGGNNASDTGPPGDDGQDRGQGQGTDAAEGNNASDTGPPEDSEQGQGTATPGNETDDGGTGAGQGEGSNTPSSDVATGGDDGDRGQGSTKSGAESDSGSGAA